MYGPPSMSCLLYTSDAADDGESVDLGGRRIIKKKKKKCFFFFSFFLSFFFFQAEDGIRDQPRSRGLGDVYKRQVVFQLYCKSVFHKIRTDGMSLCGKTLIGKLSPK